MGRGLILLVALLIGVQTHADDLLFSGAVVEDTSVEDGSDIFGPAVEVGDQARFRLSIDLSTPPAPLGVIPADSGSGAAAVYSLSGLGQMDIDMGSATYTCDLTYMSVANDWDQAPAVPDQIDGWSVSAKGGANCGDGNLGFEITLTGLDISIIADTSLFVPTSLAGFTPTFSARETRFDPDTSTVSSIEVANGTIGSLVRRGEDGGGVPLPMVLSVPDFNGDGTPEVAVVRNDSTVVQIRDGEGGALLRNLSFLSPAFTPVAAIVLPDTDGDEMPELALLAVRNVDSRIIAQIRNLDGSGVARQLWFATGHTAIAIAVIEGDVDDNGVPELAVLSTRNSDGLGVVEVRNAIGAANARTIWGPAGFAPIDMEVVPDADDNDVPDIAVLSTRNSDGRILVQVRNANGTGGPYSTWFAQGFKAIDLVVIPDKDADGIPEVGVLSSRDSDGRAMVELKNAAGAAQNRHLLWMPAGYTGIAIEALDPAPGNTLPQVAVLLNRNSDSRALVSVRNAYGADVPRSLLYPVGYTAHSFAILPGVDGNDIDDAAVLMTRDSDGRTLVQSRNTAGAPEPRNYWFAP